MLFMAKLLLHCLWKKVCLCVRKLKVELFCIEEQTSKQLQFTGFVKMDQSSFLLFSSEIIIIVLGMTISRVFDSTTRQAYI